jgi:hypothetical protein
MKKHSVHIACAKSFGTAAFLAASAFPVAAQSDFSLKLGAARAVFDEKADFSVAGRLSPALAPRSATVRRSGSNSLIDSPTPFALDLQAAYR